MVPILKLNTILFTDSNNGKLQLLYSNTTEEQTKLISTRLNEIYPQLAPKKELMLPLLEQQVYCFFYVVVKDSKKFVICVLAKSDRYNYFFNEIPFLKFKAHQLILLMSNYSIEELQNELLNWFDAFELVDMHKYSNIIQLTDKIDDFESLIYLTLIGKKIIIYSDNSIIIGSILQILHILSPHNYLNILKVTNKEQVSPKFNVLVSNKNLKLKNEFIELNMEKLSIKYKQINTGFTRKLLTLLAESSAINETAIKNEIRPVITEVLNLLDLLQLQTDDSQKTKTLEAMKKDSGSEVFQIIIELANTINKDVEKQVTSLTNMEKKYSSFLSDF